MIMEENVDDKLNDDKIDDEPNNNNNNNNNVLNKLIHTLHNNTYTVVFKNDSVQNGHSMWTVRVPTEWDTKFKRAIQKLNPDADKSEILRGLIYTYMTFADVVDPAPQYETQEWTDNDELKYTDPDAYKELQQIPEDLDNLASQWNELSRDKKKLQIHHWHSKSLLDRLKQRIQIDADLEIEALK